MDNDNFENKTEKKSNLLFWLIGGLILLAVIIYLLFTVVFNNGSNSLIPGTTNNTNSKILSDVHYKNLAFSDISLVKEKDVYVLKANVINNGKEAFTEKQVDFILKDEKGKIISNIGFYIGDTLKPNEKRALTTSVKSDTDLTKAASREVIQHN